MALDSAKLRESIESIKNLPTLPMVVHKLSEQVANPSTNAADIGRIIEQDQSLTTNVLRLVNSAYYGFPKQIKSVQHAVVILGFGKVKTLVLTASVFGIIKSKSSDRLDLPQFWLHSLTTAIAAKATADLRGGSHYGETAFIGGLLHDIGKVIMDQFHADIYRPVLEAARDRRMLLVEAEKEILGVTHAQIGAWVMEKWRLPSNIVGMVRQHHDPEQANESRDTVEAVHVGDVMAKALGLGHGGDDRMPVIHPGIAARYPITQDFLERLLSAIMAETAKAREFFDILLDAGSFVS